MKMRLTIALTAMAISTSLHAQSSSATFVIASLTTGWTADQVLIRPPGTAVNPAGCSMTDGYMTASHTPGYKAHYAAALLAFASGRPVMVNVDNTACDSGRPRIIGLTVWAQ